MDFIYGSCTCRLLKIIIKKLPSRFVDQLLFLNWSPFLIEFHFPREMYERQHGVHQVHGPGQYTQHAHRDAYGSFGSHADVFVFVLIADPIVQGYAAHGDKHEHADEIHYDVLLKYQKKEKNSYAFAII